MLHSYPILPVYRLARNSASAVLSTAAGWGHPRLLVNGGDICEYSERKRLPLARRHVSRGPVRAAGRSAHPFGI